MHNTAVIIINWNALETTRACIGNILNWDCDNIKIIIVDNGSDDEQCNDLTALSSNKVSILFNAANLGYAGANNKGIAYAIDQGFEFVLLLNNDASLGVDSFIKLRTFLVENKSSIVVGPLMLDYSTNKVLNAGGLDIANHDVTHLKYPLDDETPYLVDYVSGTVFFTRASIFKTYGMLDEAYFFSGEIADFCFRLPQQCWVHPKAIAKHDMSQAGEIRSTLYTYYTVRNRYLYISKNHRTVKWRYFAYWWNIHFRHALMAFKQKRRPESMMVVRGIFDGLRGRSGIF